MAYERTGRPNHYVEPKPYSAQGKSFGGGAYGADKHYGGVPPPVGAHGPGAVDIEQQVLQQLTEDMERHLESCSGSKKETIQRLKELARRKNEQLAKNSSMIDQLRQDVELQNRSSGGLMDTEVRKNQSLRDEIKHIKQKNLELQRKLNDKAYELEVLQEKTNQHDVDKQRHSHVFSQWESGQEELTRLKREVKQSRQKQQQSHMNLEGDKENRRREIKKVQRELDRCKKELQQETDKNREIEAELAGQAKRAAALERKLQKYKRNVANVNEMKRNVESLQNEIQSQLGNNGMGGEAQRIRQYEDIARRVRMQAAQQLKGAQLQKEKLVAAFNRERRNCLLLKQQLAQGGGRHGSSDSNRRKAKRYKKELEKTKQVLDKTTSNLHAQTQFTANLQRQVQKDAILINNLVDKNRRLEATMDQVKSELRGNDRGPLPGRMRRHSTAHSLATPRRVRRSRHLRARSQDLSNSLRRMSQNSQSILHNIGGAGGGGGWRRGAASDIGVPPFRRRGGAGRRRRFSMPGGTGSALTSLARQSLNSTMGNRLQGLNLRRSRHSTPGPSMMPSE